MKSPDDLMEPDVALRVLANSVGEKWWRNLNADHRGLGHIHDLWNEMYKDMEAIVCLEKHIADAAGDVTGSDFRPVKGFEKYGPKDKGKNEAGKNT